jgi:hypothetical protein
MNYTHQHIRGLIDKIKATELTQDEISAIADVIAELHCLYDRDSERFLQADMRNYSALYLHYKKMGPLGLESPTIQALRSTVDKFRALCGTPGYEYFPKCGLFFSVLYNGQPPKMNAEQSCRFYDRPFADDQIPIDFFAPEHDFNKAE